METKKNKMCKVRLRRLRPDMMDKLKAKRGITKSDVQISSSSSESDDDEANDDECEKISVQIRSSLALGSNKDYDPYILLSEAQAALKLSSENKSIRDAEESLNENATICSKLSNNASDTSAALMTAKKLNKKSKLSKKDKPLYYPPLEMTSSNACISNSAKLKSTIENDIYDLIYYHSDDERPCSYNCSHVRRSSNASLNALAPTDCRSSSGSSSSSDKCSMRYSKLLKNNCISVMDHENPPTALSKILSIKEFDPLAPQQIIAIVIKSIVSLAELSRREDNIVCIDIDKKRILEFSAMSPEEKRNCPLNPYMDVSNIIVTHTEDEFLTFCLCENCEKYREFVIHIMVEQFKATHMVVMLLDVLIQSYGPMLKNITAYNKFKKLLDSNKEIYWITCGVIYHKKAEHLDFIYDECLSDNMIFVLFSSILMLNNPLLLLQILAFHVECIVKAYAEGFLEIVEPDKSKIPADEMINYILNGYDDLMRISEQVASYLFAFENDFLRKFSLTWKLLSQRLYQQHVHLHLADTMLACIITLKEEELTAHHTELIRRYIQFDDIMNYVEKRWIDVWIELNKFNLSEVERKRRKSLLDVYRIFDTVVQDAIGFSLQDSVDDNDFYDFRFLKNRRLAWRNIMSYTKMKWPDGFFQPPNTLVVDDKCQTCSVSLEYHADYCKCITCSIAGGPLPPKRHAEGKCSKCLAHEIVEKDVNFYDSKILNVCTNDDFQDLVSKTSNNGAKPKSNALQEVGQELGPSLAIVGEMLSMNESEASSETTESTNSYHISWAVFNHLNNRKRYPYATIDEQYFCRECKLPSCLLALNILNNKISPSLSQDLVHYYQPISMSRDELRSILPNIMLYNRKLVASNNGLDLIDVHDLVVKIYWIFVISLYAIYFIDYNDKNDDCKTRNSNKQNDDKVRAYHLEALELANNDIKVNVKKLIGNKDDTKFLEFLDKVKSLSPYNNDVESNFEVGDSINSDEIQKKLNDFLKITDDEDISSIPFQCDNIPPPALTHTEDEELPQSLDPIPPIAVEAQPKKTSKEKPKKCCFDHSETGGEHCKENHLSKKRLKKDCNHARMNETRERLRKKLSQIVTTRKNSKLQLAESSQTSNATQQQTSATDYLDARDIMEHFLNPEELKLFQHYLPRPDFWDIHDFVASFDHIYNEARRNEEKKNLCECLQNFKANSKSESKNKSSNKKFQQNHQRMQQQQMKLQLPSPLEQQQSNESIPSSIQSISPSIEPPNKKSNISNNSTRDASTSSQGTKFKENSSTNATSPISSSKVTNNFDFVNEICEIIDNYSKEQAKRKWIKETLSFIEGPNTGSGKKKIQPQTLNPKKAAKKAKQKQRKEEEKRIAELQDLRAQFHNIYFKEFSEKHCLKSLKANKKRDKKKISELETNIKNLQRAKAKVETAILELIATVKQTNNEFKFSYLPTKEQQQEKIRELEGYNNKDTDRTFKVRNLLHQTAKEAIHVTSTASPFTETPTNNLNMVPESYSMPYAHANHFPYNLGFPPPAANVPFGLLRASPMCYPPSSTASVSPIQPQPQLTPDVVAAMNANATSNNTTDPSKRIVTIRRVNLPNVPEPQVTVTAKGPSPDKDKLLYTFINGQLIQTGTAPPITIPQLSTINSMQTQIHTPVSMTPEKMTAEHILSIPPPPPPALSKTQMKKERKRLAKLQAEKEAAEEAERKQIEEEQQKLRELKEQKQLEIQRLEQQQQLQQKLQTKKKKKNPQMQQQTKSSICKDSTKQNKKNKLLNTNSTTAISTDKNTETAKLPQIIAVKNSAKQKRHDSTTTSCSAATSTSSNNSTSSQMNTRDNSVSSLRPAKLCIKNSTSKDEKLGNKQKINNASMNIKAKTSQPKLKQNKKPTRIPPTPSTTSSEAEDEVVLLAKTKNNNSPPPPLKLSKTPQVSKTKSTPKQNKIAQKIKPVQKPITPPSSESETEEEVVNIEPTVRERKERRPKLVDNGQFDNNPFKSLHMQDSESDWSSEEEEDKPDENGYEIIFKTKTIPAVDKILERKSDKDKNFVKSAMNFSIKNVNTESMENKTKPSSPTYQTDNKNVTNKNSKTNKIIKYQKQDEKSSKQNNSSRESERLLGHEVKTSNQTEVLKTSTQQNTSNNRKAKNDSRLSNSSALSSQTKLSNKPATACSTRNEKITSSTSSRNNSNTVNRCNNNKNQNKLEHNQLNQNNYMSPTTCDNAENKNQSNKRSQRNKKYQQKSQKHSLSLHQNHTNNCCPSGIPNHMGYFNANELNLTSSSASHTSGNSNTFNHNRSYQSLAEQMQALRLSGHQVQTTTTMATDQQRQQHINSANVSIMDQLNRGVQVENLSLPPGITLTKVDPLKSEQLRQKSESIKKLAKPLQQQTQHLSQNSHAFHHSSSGATIIAPPVVNPIANYYGSSYINAANAGISPQSGVIMVEANPPKISNVPQANVINNCNSKQSKNKKRRNKSKAIKNLPCSMKNTGNNENSRQSEIYSSQPKMITLKNPMFHSGPTVAAATMLQQQTMLPGCSVDGFSMPVPLPVDQPAAIIKNENGMYTIRNPALHQAVTSGLTMGGYRQFGGNVNYYTPQEAAAEAARATLKQQKQLQQQQHIEDKSSSTNGNNPSSYSYFSNETVQTSKLHNNISISCTSISGAELNPSNMHVQRGNSVGGLIGDAAVIQRPAPQQQRPISAIGSEIKSAQQQKQKTKIEQWSNFVSDSSLPITSVGGGGAVPVTDLSLQEKYQQSKYYNGFEVFTGSSGGSNSSAATCAHMHHSCGDDSPPPSISGYNSYLDGIPNTGVIRYDDASFLKNLIPGQNLNNEVSIHNVNDSSFVRNDPTQSHRVEITTVFGNRPSSTNLYESSSGQANQSNFIGNYRDTINDYNNDANVIFTNNMHMNLNELETSLKYDFEPTPSTNVTDDNSHNTIFDNLLIKNGPTGSASCRTSPYLDENSLDGFVQNMNSLQISGTSCEEQSSQLNGSGQCVGEGTSAASSSNKTPNGWW